MKYHAIGTSNGDSDIYFTYPSAFPLSRCYLITGYWFCRCMTPFVRTERDRNTMGHHTPRKIQGKPFGDRWWIGQDGDPLSWWAVDASRPIPLSYSFFPDHHLDSTGSTNHGTSTVRLQNMRSLQSTTSVTLSRGRVVRRMQVELAVHSTQLG